MQLCLSQVCSLPAPFEQVLADYAAGACPGVEIWLTKLEQHLENHTPADVRRSLDEHGLAAPVASYQGGLLTSQGDARREHWAHFERRLELCREVGIGTVVVAGDIFGPLTQTDLDRVHASLTQAAQQAGQRGLRIALEFQAGAAFLNNLQTCAAVIAEIGSPHLGVCLDLFHYYTGPSKPEDLAYLTPANLFHVQLSDLAGHARELATDSDRILPGDGDIPLAPVVQHLRDIGYQGPVSIELPNPTIWPIPAKTFGEIAMTALRKALGLASMGGP